MQAFVLGGGMDVADISLRCRALNSFESERVLGAWLTDATHATRSGPNRPQVARSLFGRDLFEASFAPRQVCLIALWAWGDSGGLPIYFSFVVSTGHAAALGCRSWHEVCAMNVM